MTVILVVFTAAICAMLLRAGAGKLTVPAPLGAALAELTGRAAVPASLVRVLAVVELALALLVPFAGRSPVVPAGAAALGIAFAAVGVVGRTRRTRKPCGCFGATSGGSFGGTNILAGLALVAWAGLAFAYPLDDYRAASLLLGLIVVIGGLCWSNRKYIPLFFNAVTAIRRTS
ncbi:MauE/DoxX family redox-associated membrane protein [Dactylosporangium sp. CA-139066]|uniref:MauE/DoxX family redox-associated membrane protein n=1 Tax=Dactylosporangium sp. CA-139066 TaxID=3239930 RepID=UPI003D8B9446